MPEWTLQLLLFVFATHAPFFAWRYHRTREVRHAATTLTFALLTIAYALRVFAPYVSLGGVPLHSYARAPALLSALLSIGLLLRHLWRRSRSGARGSDGRRRGWR